MKIGPHTLSNRLFVAPMAGVTDRPFRQLCKTLGAGYAVSEMVASNALLWKSEKTQRRANHQGEFKPIAVQIAGADPAMMAAAAKVNVDHGAQIIDINMGCPVPKIAKHNAGCSLMREPEHAAAVVGAMAKAVKIPVTVKMRAGWNEQQIDRKSTRLNSSHMSESRMPSSA